MRNLLTLQTPRADGVVRKPDGEIQELEFCQGFCQEENDHVWMTYNGTVRFGEEDGNDTVVEESGDSDRTWLEGNEPSDRQGPYTISMFVYYTTAFKNAVPDVKGFIDDVGGIA